MEHKGNRLLFAGNPKLNWVVEYQGKIGKENVYTTRKDRYIDSIHEVLHGNVPTYSYS